MLIFNCTKAAADFFTSIRQCHMSPKPKIALTEEPILHDHQYWHWMIHVTKLGRRNVLLAMDTDSRFCMLFWGLRKGNIQNFLQQFHERLSLHVISVINMSGQDKTMLETTMKAFSKSHHEYAFVQRGDRSVQAHINDVFMALYYEQYRWEDDAPSEEELFVTDIRNNDTPRKRKQDNDSIFPTKILFSTWLSHYANLDEQTIMHTISQYQQTKRDLWKSQFDIDIDAVIAGRLDC